jgi:hypothetical protein
MRATCAAGQAGIRCIVGCVDQITHNYWNFRGSWSNTGNVLPSIGRNSILKNIAQINVTPLDMLDMTEFRMLKCAYGVADVYMVVLLARNALGFKCIVSYRDEGQAYSGLHVVGGNT